MNSQAISKNRFANQIKASLDSSYISEFSLAFPSVYYFGISIVCDIHCPYCPRQFYIREIDSGFMDFDSFLKTSKYLNYGEHAYFFGLGEPFLHPRFFDFVRESMKTGIKTGTSTHGMSLNPSARNSILESGMHELLISIDATDSKTFAMLRKGANLEDVVSNTLDIQKAKKERGLDKPDIIIAAAVSSHNVQQLSAIVRLAKRLGAVRVVFTDLILVNPEKALASVSRTDLFWDQFQRAQILGKKLGVETLYFYQYPFPWKKDPAPSSDSTGKTRICGEPWRMCVVNRHGEMKPCCYYPPNTGDIFKNPLEEIINNEENRLLRRRLLKGDLPECCLNCGMLVEFTPEQSLKAIQKAESLLAQARERGDFTQKEIDDLSRLTTTYKNMWKELYSQ